MTHDRFTGWGPEAVASGARISRGPPHGESRCVFSPEEPVFPQGRTGPFVTRPPWTGDPGVRRLNCNSGMGSSVFVTGTFGLVAMGRLVDRILAANP